MTADRARIVSPVHLPDGSLAPDGAKIIFTLTGWDKNATSIIMGGPSEVVVESGAIDTYVHRVGAGDRQSAILVTSCYFNGASRRWITEDLGLIAPDGPGPYDLADLLAIPAPVPTVPDALAQALGAAAAADADAAATAADRVQTGLDAAATAADREQTNANVVLADAAVDAAVAARDAAALSSRIFSSTAAGLGSGVAGAASIVAGSGGTNGTFSLAFSGGTQVIAPAGVFVVAGGALASITITAPGYYSSGSPTLSFAACSGLTGASATAVMAANTNVGEYFSVPATLNDSLTLYRVDAGPTATALSTIPSGVLAGRSMFSGNDFRTGSTGWTVTGFDTTVYDASGLTASRAYASGGTGWTGRILKTVSGGIALTAGHRYAMYADVSLVNNGVSAVATVLSRPFLLTGPGSLTVGTRLAVGAVGTPIRTRIVTVFDETTTGARGNPYFDLSNAKDAAAQSMAAFDITAVMVSYMIVDLGVSGSAFYSISAADLANVIPALGAPYHPYPSGLVALSQYAAVASVASHANEADSAATAVLATMAETTRSPWENRRILTIGHSLVSQVNWQPSLKKLLSLEGYSVQGTAGGTLQPKPSDGTKGMFSRTAMTSMLSGIINFNDAGAGGIGTVGLTTALKLRTAATIFWTGANDALMDLNNSPYGSLAANREKIESLEARVNALSVGHYASKSVGLAAVALGAYYTAPGAVTGFRIMYLKRNVGAGDFAQTIYHYPYAGQSFETDRIMTTAEQDEFEARNTSQGANAFLSEPLTNGFIVSYEALWHTMIANYMAATGFDTVKEHRWFIVREPQAFWSYDGTIDWPQGYYEKNEVHRRVADRWGIPLIDLWTESGINLATRGFFIQSESGSQLFIHINSAGGLQVANVVSRRMLQHPPLDFTGLTSGTYTALPTIAADLSPWTADNVVST